MDQNSLEKDNQSIVLTESILPFSPALLSSSLKPSLAKPEREIKKRMIRRFEYHLRFSNVSVMPE